MKFKPIPDYGGEFEISLEGVVRKIYLHRPPKVLVPHVDKNGYVVVSLCSKGTVKKKKIHRLLLSTFVRQPEDGEVARHLDGNPGNNRLSNLAWGTQTENEADKRKHGTHANTLKTCDPKGHEYDDINLMYNKKGERKCRSCHRADQFIIRERKRGKELGSRRREVQDYYYQNRHDTVIFREEVLNALRIPS